MSVCAVCRSAFSGDRELVRLHCGHTVHLRCIRCPAGGRQCSSSTRDEVWLGLLEAMRLALDRTPDRREEHKRDSDQEEEVYFLCTGSDPVRQTRLWREAKQS